MSIKHEKILRRLDDTRIKIEVNFCEFNNRYMYDVLVCTCQPNKRKWKTVQDFNDYGYRGLSIEDRDREQAYNESRVVTKEEILQAKLELWEKLKPTL